MKIGQGKPKPDDVIELSKTNPAVRSCLMYWRQGHLSWEEMLTTCVLVLANQNKFLEEHAKIEMENRPSQFFDWENLLDNRVDPT